MKRLLNILYLVLCAVNTMAQEAASAGSEQVMHARVHVWSETAGTKEYRTMQYALFRTEKNAKDVIPALQDALSRMNSMGGTVDAEAWQKVCTQRKIKFRRTKENGEFGVRAYPDMALLVCTYDPANELTSDGARFTVITLRAGQTDYDYLFKKKVGEGTYEINNVDIYGQSRDTASFVAIPAIEDDRYVYFKIHVELPAGYASEKSRLVIQPVAVDCETEDTVDYVKGIVMEGVEYHRLQEKRMRFNYMKNDKVAFAYIDKPLWSDERIYVDTTMVYVKKDSKHTYRIPYTVELSDLNHVYYRMDVPGHQNSRDIYKLINLGTDDMLMAPKVKAERISKYNTFKNGFVKYAMHQLPPAKEKEVADAMNAVFSYSPENKAVIYTEARDILNVPYSENLRLIDALEDINPKKWYLRGILEADREEKTSGVKTVDIQMGSVQSYIPEYLCYFYAAFELDPSYKWLYFKDGQISDALRAKYHYSKHKLAQYRLMFYNKIAKNQTSVEIKRKTADDADEIEISGE